MPAPTDHLQRLLLAWRVLLGRSTGRDPVKLVLQALPCIFVLFDIGGMACRACGIGVERFWHCPIASASLSEFWGQRWNRIVSGLLREVLCLPLARRTGAVPAMFVVFFYSGLFHETFSIAA